MKINKEDTLESGFGFGLNPLDKDERDAQVGNILTLPKNEDIPKEFEIPPFEIFDQRSSDFCAGASSTGASMVQEGVKLFYPWVFAKAKEGNVNSWGSNLRDVAKVHQKYGCPEWKDVSDNIIKKYNDGDWDFLRRIENYPIELYDKALKHRKASYLFITPMFGKDGFDMLRAVLWKFKEEKKLPFLGLLWSWSLYDYILEDNNNGGSGHAILNTGFKDNYLILTGSNGCSVGKDGKHLVVREVVNKHMGKYGAIIFTDLQVENVKKLQQQTMWYNANTLKKLEILLRKLFTLL